MPERQVQHTRRRIEIETKPAPERAFTDPYLLERISQLEEQGRRRDAAISGSAHEMRAPVAMLTGYLELLEQRKIGALNQQQQEAVEMMKLNCRRLEHLVSEFVTFGLLGSGRAVVRFETNDLAVTLHELARQWQPAFAMKQVDLRLQLGDLRPFAFDRHRIEQMVSNLLDNALRFTPVNGKVLVEALPHFWERRVHAQPASVERRREQKMEFNAALIAVSDSGPGVAPEYWQEIFEPFVSMTYGKSRPSSGLGLAIARSTVQAHKGKIWVESEPSSGSRFFVVLPR